MSTSNIIIACLVIFAVLTETTPNTNTTIWNAQSDPFHPTNGVFGNIPDATDSQRSQVIAINRNDGLSPAEKQIAIDRLVMQDGWQSFKDKWHRFKSSAAQKIDGAYLIISKSLIEF
jgi:hypothetical protein